MQTVSNAAKPVSGPIIRSAPPAQHSSHRTKTKNLHHCPKVPGHDCNLVTLNVQIFNVMLIRGTYPKYQGKLLIPKLNVHFYKFGVSTSLIDGILTSLSSTLPPSSSANGVNMTSDPGCWAAAMIKCLARLSTQLF